MAEVARNPWGGASSCSRLKQADDDDNDDEQMNGHA